MAERNIIIFTAVGIEARAVGRYIAPLSGQLVHLHTVGIRATRLPGDASVSGARGIVLAGLAGALDPTLQIGDIVIDDQNGLVPAPIQHRRGPIVSADEIVATPQEKAELFRKTNALAVDMEGSIVRELAVRLKVPFIHVRSISDTADQTLDPRVLGFVDDVGNVRPVRLAAGLVRRPNLIPYLNRLGKNSKLAAERLGDAVREIVQAMR